MPISPLVAEIARRILDMIEAGLLTAGARLKEDDLADRFQVSRSPVREVLQMLAQNRIVEREAHRGTFVAAKAKPVDLASTASVLPRNASTAAWPIRSLRRSLA